MKLTTIPERCEELIKLHGSQGKAARAINMDEPLFSYLKRGLHKQAKNETLAKLGLRRVYVLDE